MAGDAIRPAATRSSKSRRSGGGQQEDVKGRWLTTYADAITLLMAFFVLLYAMSEIDVIKFTAFLQGLRDPFGNEAGESMLPASDGLLPDLTAQPVGDPSEQPDIPSRFVEQTPESDEDGDEQSGRDEQDQLGDLTTEELMALIEAQDDAGIDAAEMLALLEDADRTGLDDSQQRLLEEAERRAQMEAQLDTVQDALTTALTQEGVELLVDQRRTERGLVVTIASDDVLFALGSTVIDAVGQDIVRVISDTLRDFPNQIQIEGHTCTVPLTRPGYTNWNLSTDRAVAVLSSMVEDHGLAPYRVGAVGYGEYRPFASNDTAEGRARNRRVDVVILLEEPPT